jgi:pilus assembly protein CpaB
MNRRLGMIVTSALLIATVATYIVYRIANSRLTGNTSDVNRIVVASKDLPTGTVIRAVDLNYANWNGPAPKGFKNTTKDLVGRGVVSPMYEGEPVTENRLAAAGAGGGLAATIPSGMRACAVRVNEVVGVAGFVVPGMRVDVLISGNPTQTPASGPRVKTLLQNVEVLSAGHNYQKDAEGKPVEVPVVNLLVTPEQAEVLSLASNETRIQLVLRNPMDHDTAKTAGSAMADLFGEAPPAKPQPAVVRVATPRAPVPQPAAPPAVSTPVLQTQRVEVLNGPKRTEASFTASEENR